MPHFLRVAFNFVDPLPAEAPVADTPAATAATPSMAIPAPTAPTTPTVVKAALPTVFSFSLSAARIFWDSASKIDVPRL